MSLGSNITEKLGKPGDEAIISRNRGGIMAAEFLTNFAVMSVIVATLGVGSIAAFVVWLLSSKISSTDRLVVMWLVYNSLIHFILVSYKIEGCGLLDKRL